MRDDDADRYGVNLDGDDLDHVDTCRDSGDDIDVAELLDDAQEWEKQRIPEEIDRIDEQLRRREQIREENKERVKQSLREVTQRLVKLSVEVQDSDEREREERRFRELQRNLERELRELEKGAWRNQKELLREWRELVRELSEVDDSEVVDRMLDGADRVDRRVLVGIQGTVRWGTGPDDVDEYEVMDRVRDEMVGMADRPAVVH
jgi:hypothetical protein